MTFDDLKPFLNSAIRHGLTLLGGALMAKGAITSAGAESVVEGLSGLLVGVVGLAWSQLHVGRLAAAGKMLDAIPPSAIETIAAIVAQLANALGAAHRVGDIATASQLGATMATLVGSPAPAVYTPPVDPSLATMASTADEETHQQDPMHITPLTQASIFTPPYAPVSGAPA